MRAVVLGLLLAVASPAYGYTPTVVPLRRGVTMMLDIVRQLVTS